MLRLAGRYLVQHWQGRQGLFWSFWINLVAVRAVILLAQEAVEPAVDSDYSASTLLVILLAVFFHGVVFVWQIVGVLRAGEIYLRDTGSQAAYWGAQLGLLAAFWLTASYALDAWQMTLPVPQNDILARLDAERSSRYTIRQQEGGVLAFAGSIELGVTRNLARILAEDNAIATITLHSDGGNVYEARGMARLIRESGLDTRVDILCSSACTAAFIGGKRRIIKRGARLGFHQYRVDADYAVWVADPEKEQERDRQLYAASKVAPWFLEKMFERQANEMWFPPLADLLRAGVVHEVAE